MFICFDTIMACDRRTHRQTDRQTDRNTVDKTALSIAACCKNQIIPCYYFQENCSKLLPLMWFSNSTAWTGSKHIVSSRHNFRTKKTLVYQQKVEKPSKNIFAKANFLNSLWENKLYFGFHVTSLLIQSYCRSNKLCKKPTKTLRRSLSGTVYTIDALSVTKQTASKHCM